MQLDPYIFFYGRTAEALEFYKKALGGEYELSRVSESPMSSQFPPDAQNRVMHSTFKGPGFSFMASDGREDKAIGDDGAINLALTTSDAAEGQRVFKALSDGGKVSMPLNEVPWGGSFGMLVDRFGLEWMVSIR